MSAETPSRLDLLVGEHRNFLAFLEKRVGDRAAAEDILQEAFVRSLDTIDEVRSDEAVQAWFYRVLRNAAIDWHRRRGADARKLEALAREMDEEAAPGGEMDQAICTCVRRLAEGLQPNYAEAIRRVDLEGLPVRQFAEEVGITHNNAGVRLHRARAALRREVMASCGTCAEHGCLDCTC